MIKNVSIAALSCILLLLPSFAEQLNPVLPAEALATLHLPEDVEIQLIASEPVVEDPVAMAFDTEGRLYVVENRGYPSDEDNRGRVSILKDLDGDGYYESRTIFADGFPFPNGVLPWKGGVLVTSAPTVYFLKDTDGDDVADVREDFLTGFKLGGSTQLYVSHPTLGLDNWLYFTNGLSGGEVIDPLHPEAAPVVMGSDDLRFNPLTRALEATAGRAQFGQTFDNYGHRFVCTNRKHISQVMMQRGDLARNPYAGVHEVEDEIAGLGSETHLYALSEATTTAYSHAGTFTAACGLVIYRGTALPAPYQQNGYTCDPTSNIVHRTILEGDGPAYHGRRGREGVEFLASTDNWFRPVFLTNGPDGALYLCDMYRKTIEHPQYLPKDVIAVTDFESGKSMGRIYRIAGKGSAKPRSLAANALDIPALVATLAAEDSWQRETAHRLLLTEVQTSAELLEALRQSFKNSPSPLARLHCLYLLEGHGALDEAMLIAAMQDADAALREHGVRLARPRIGESDALFQAVSRAAGDETGRVRYYAALALGDLDREDTIAPLLAVAQRGLDDSWVRAALFTGLKSNIAPFTAAFIDAGALADPAADTWMEPLGRMVAQSQPEAAASALLGQILKSGQPLDAPVLLASLDGIAEGIRRNGAYDRAAPALAHMARLTQELPAASTALGDVLAQCQAYAKNIEAPVTKRLSAIQLLGYGSFAEYGEALAGLLQPRETQEIRQSAVQALGMFSDAGAAEVLASESAWGLYSAPIRKAALATLMARPERTAVLLSALEAGTIQAWSIDPISRRQLVNHKDEALKARAVAIFSKVEQSDRNAVYEDYKTIFDLTADPIAGREVFKNNCSGCHKFQQDGFEVGPDLTGIRSQPRESILLHIIKPNSEVLAGYENFVIETRNFETFSGIIVAENENTVTIRGAMGVENTVNRADIDSMSSASLSLMPEELEKVMSKQQMRDLIGFLKGEKGGG